MSCLEEGLGQGGGRGLQPCLPSPVSSLPPPQTLPHTLSRAFLALTQVGGFAEFLLMRAPRCVFLIG